MRLGLSTGLSHTDAKNWAKTHMELGCGAIVFPLDCYADRQSIRDYVEAAGEAGLIIAEVGIWRNVVAADEEERKKARDFAIGQLALADEIGARCAVNVAGAVSGKRWDGAYVSNFEAEAWEKTVESVRTIIDAVKPKNTKYALEPMPWMIPTGPEEYLRLLKDIDRIEAGVHIDIVNMINCPERYFYQRKFMKECFDKLKGRICSCHLKDIHLREEFTFQLEEIACGKGELDIEYYTELATAEREDMPMIIEHLHNEDEYINSLKYVQQRLGSAGIRFNRG